MTLRLVAMKSRLRLGGITAVAVVAVASNR
jgi:hypothetical protein